MNRKKKHKLIRCAAVVSGTAIFLLLLCVVLSCFFGKKGATVETMDLSELSIQKKLIKVNKYSRPGIGLPKVNGIVVHYTANPGATAIQNRNYFNNLRKQNEQTQNPVYASSHFVIGIAGEIVQCIPLNEISYASNGRNSDTISIECCHKDESGKFTKLTYNSLVDLVTYLCLHYNLDSNDVIRHYDVTGKNCPKYFVEHKNAWEKFKEDVTEKINSYK